MTLISTWLLIAPSWSEPVFDLSDTGVDEEEVYKLDYVDIWPTKIVLDATANKCKLVWFETETPRHTDIPFSDIATLKLIPQYEGRPNELQLHLKDGRSFLLDMGPQVRKTAQTFTALSKVPVQDGSSKDTRIVPKPKPERAKPVLTVGAKTCIVLSR